MDMVDAQMHGGCTHSRHAFTHSRPRRDPCRQQSPPDVFIEGPLCSIDIALALQDQDSRLASRLSSLGARQPSIAPPSIGQLDTPTPRPRPRPRPPLSTALLQLRCADPRATRCPLSTATPTQSWRSTLRPSSALSSRCARMPRHHPRPAPPQLQLGLGLTPPTGWLQDCQRLGTPLSRICSLR